jgi:hypothetical protein
MTYTVELFGGNLADLLHDMRYVRSQPDQAGGISPSSAPPGLAFVSDLAIGIRHRRLQRLFKDASNSPIRKERAHAG